MIIEMTYGEWLTIHGILGDLNAAELDDEQCNTAIRLRDRIRMYSYDN